MKSSQFSKEHVDLVDYEESLKENSRIILTLVRNMHFKTLISILKKIFAKFLTYFELSAPKGHPESISEKARV